MLRDSDESGLEALRGSRSRRGLERCGALLDRGWKDPMQEITRPGRDGDEESDESSGQ
jgi:hypothetical protein